VINLASTTQLSLLLFGGEVKVKVSLPILNELGIPIQIKTGKNRGKVKTKLTIIKKYKKGLGLIPLKEWFTKKERTYQTNDKVLKYLISHSKSKEAIEICHLILELRNKSKQLSTYYNEDIIYPDSCIRTQYQQVLTPTGRISSKNPNLQNIPKNKKGFIKQHFTSRFAGGEIINSDYRQIEVLVFAILSNDVILQDILLQGIDLYKYLAAEIDQINIDEVTPEQRNDTKVPALGIIYGNGARTLSQNCGKDEKWCKTFIQTFYELFPIARQWHIDIQEIVAQTGYLEVFTGQEFRFDKKPAKYDWQFEQGIQESYNPPDIKNHPVQGTAFIFMIIMLGKFWREKCLLKRDKYLLINTVHDSIMLDVRKEYIEEAKKDMELLANIKEMCYKVFKKDIKLEIKQEISSGHSWYDLQ
jgi:DNA polymerase I